MNLQNFIQENNGFTAIETVIAILIFSTMALIIAKTLTSVTYAVEQSGHRRKSATLASMVLEQYDAYAANSYDTLASYNTERVLPRQFFNTADNLGYDAYAISTHSDCAEDGSTCQVTVGILTGHGAQARTVTYTKNYDENQLSAKNAVGSGL
jgi:prepilin-type N-terminal cleavage/methylation domain-containing protein